MEATEKSTKPRMVRALYKFIGALSPISYLARARDFYVHGMTQFGERAHNLGVVGATGVTMTLPRSFSLNSSSLRDNDHDYRELIRAASQRGRATPIKITKLSDHQPFNRSLSASTEKRNRQQIISVGRIDEESPSDFSGSLKQTLDEDLRFPRSRSCSSVKN